MSSTSVSSRPRSQNRSEWTPSDSERYIQDQLRRTQRQLKLVDLVSSTLLLLAGLVSGLLLLILFDHWIYPLPVWGRWLAFLGLLAGIGVYLARVLWPLWIGRINPVYAARSIEQSDPTLKNSLVNFLLFRDDRAGLRAAIYSALERRAATDLSHVEIETAVDYSRVIRLGYLLAGILALAAAYTILVPKSPFQSFARVVAPWGDIERPSRVRIEDVQPGNTRVFRGQSLEISARCYDVRDGEPVFLYYSTLDKQATRVPVPMQLDPDGLVHRGSLPPGEDAEGIQSELIYWIEAGDAITPAYRVQVDPAPAILVDRVEYEFPAYTKLPRKVVEGEGDLRAVEGTQVTLHARANHPIAEAVVEFDPLDLADPPSANGASLSEHVVAARTVPMQWSGDEAQCTFTIQLDEARRRSRFSVYRIHFLTTEGQVNPQPVLHRIEAIPDLPPEIEILTPEKDHIQVPENGRQKLEVRAIDPDFGLHRMRLRGVSGGQSLMDEVLLDESDGYSGQALETYDFQPQRLGLVAGDQLTWWALAEDNRTGPDGAAAANVTKTRNYTITIVPADPPPGGTPPNPAAEPSDPSGIERPRDPPGDDPGDANSGDTPDEEPSSDPSNDDSEQSPSDADSGGDGSGGESGGGGSSSGDDAGSGSSAQQEGSTGGESGTGSSGEEGSDSSQSDSDGSSGSGGDGGGDSAASQSGETGDSASGGSSPSDAADGGSGGEGSETAEYGGGPGDQQESSEPIHDGEAFEKALEHMRRSQQASEGAGGGQSDGQETGSPADDASGQGLTSGSSKPSTPPRSQPDSGDAGQPQQPADGKTASKSPADSPQESASGKSKEGAGKQESGAGQPGGEDRDAAGKPKPSGQDGSPSGGSGSQPKPGGGQQNTPSGGTGQKPSDKPGSEPKDGSPQGGGSSGEGKKERPGSGGSGGGSPEAADQPTPSQGGGSDAQGDEGGDQSGGGKAGAGQSSGQTGTGGSGASTPSDNGTGTAQGEGTGPTGSGAGQEQTSPAPTGTPGYESGSGSQTRPATDSASMPAAAGAEGSGGDPADSPTASSSGGARRDGPGSATGGGYLGSGELQEMVARGEVPPGEAPNLDYTNKATDMVLDYLKDQAESPDQQLLKELGWTPAELQAFLRRWDQMKRAAREDSQARTELVEALRSLGLRPPPQEIRGVESQGDGPSTLSTGGAHSNPPAAYADQYRAFRKGAPRVDRP